MTEGIRTQAKIVEKGDLLGYSRSDFEFHTLIHKLSRNDVLQEMLESLKTKMQPIGMQVGSILPRLYQDHMEIIEALRGRDPDAVERVIRRHNRAVQNQIKKEIEILGKK
jgi:DNA-binding GntR family transcriptional regulator